MKICPVFMYMMCSSIYKSSSNAYHPLSTAVVPVTSDCCGDGYFPLCYCPGKLLALVFFFFNEAFMILPSVELCVCLRALKRCILSPSYCLWSLKQVLFPVPLFRPARIPLAVPCSISVAQFGPTEILLISRVVSHVPFAHLQLQ